MPANRNIKYQSDQIRNFYSTHRVKWSQLYRSEQTILEQLDLSHRTTILDIGCGSGGLGLALKERFGVERYTGVEINASAAQAAQTLNPDARILQGDILEIPDGQLGQYDLVVSLSCIDWNVEFDTMLTKAWGLVSGGGVLLLSLRLTEHEGINDIGRSYQYINFEGCQEGEVAPYVVLNAQEWINTAKALSNVGRIRAYGYYGSPSASAVTLYDQICFTVFALHKDSLRSISKLIMMLDLPISF